MSASHLLLRADARRIPLGDGTVQACVTSPPYFGLRDYGSTGQIGLEATPGAFVNALVAVFREVWRVLRDDGTCWLNLGDSFAGSWGNQGRKDERGTQRPINGPMIQNLTPYPVKQSNTGKIPEESRLKPKDLMGVPHAVAFALRDDGWYLRSAAPWVKRAAMPESVTDRPSSSVEYMFLLAKSPRYFYDIDAVRTPHRMKPQRRPNGRPIDETPRNRHPKQGWSTAARDEIGVDGHPAGRNRRNGDWWYESIAAAVDAGPAGMVAAPDGEVLGFDVTPESTSFAHFATMPTRLVEPCILAGTSAAGACPVRGCGAPWVRVVGEVAVEPDLTQRSTQHYGTAERYGAANGGNGGLDLLAAKMRAGRGRGTIGWRPTCSCNDPRPPRPCLVFDPFAGSGTTLLTARRLGRSAVGCDLSADYLALAARRIADGLRPVSKLDPRPSYAPLSGQMSFLDQEAFS